MQTKMIVGLGNPGRKYEGTRHNVGFEVLQSLSKRLAASTPKAKFSGQFTKVNFEATALVLLWPLTFMNESGRCVRPACDFFKINPEADLLVVCDDLSLPTGKLRIRPKGSAGGQKGLAHILKSCGTNDVPRLRIGIDSTPPGWETPDYVLGRFDKTQRETIDHSVNLATDAISDWCRHDLAYCMNHHN